MVIIKRANINDVRLLSEIAVLTFIESHGHSAKLEGITNYIVEKFTVDTLGMELADPKNNYYLIFYQDRIAGFSNIIFNFPYINSKIEHIAKLERLYLLKEFYDLKLGHELFHFNIHLARQNNQQGIWLFVWKENERAINFYRKKGFTVIGSFDFKLSKTHSNPNHQMFLEL